MQTAHTIKLGDLIAAALPDHDVLAGEAGLGRQVRSVTVGTAGSRVSPHSGGLVVFPQSVLTFDGIDTDIAIRYAASHSAAGLVAEKPVRPLSFATIALADKYRIPLIAVRNLDAIAVVGTLESLVRAPDLTRAGQIVAVLDELARGPVNATTVVGVMSRVLACPAAVVDAEGRLIATERTRAPVGIEWAAIVDTLSAALDTAHPAPTAVSAPGGVRVILHPIALPSARHASMWLAAQNESHGLTTDDTVRQCLALAGWAFTAQLANRSLVTERERLRRALLLTEILENASAPSSHAIESAALLGWTLSGWHVGVHVSAVPDPNVSKWRATSSALELWLERRNVPAVVVERPDGWVFWASRDDSWRPPEVAEFAKAVRGAIAGVETESDGLRLCAGLGLPRRGSEGLQQTLEDARHASILAAAKNTTAAVEQTDPGSFRRLLMTWHTNRAGREIAQQVLQPLIDNDPGGHLLDTLRCFLDFESSSTATAAVLGIHRNTMRKRLRRISELLEVDLSDPSIRLAVQLATRVVHGPPP